MRGSTGRLFLAVALVAAGCSRASAPAEDKPVRAADAACRSGEARRFYAQNATYTDEDTLDLPRADPGDVGVDARRLHRATTEVARSKGTRSFLVMSHGKLIWERYFNGASATDSENVHSVSKSVLSLVAGIAIQQGKLGLDDPIVDHLPHRLVPPEARSLTVRHLLTMSAGLEWKENFDEERLEPRESYVRQVLAADRVAKPGEKFLYNTGLTQVLSAVIEEATGRSTCRYAHDELLEPMGITIDHWLRDPDGYHAGGHSTFMTPRELARFGQFVLAGGEGRLRNAWLERSLALRWQLGCRAPSQRMSYGYLWWRAQIGSLEVWEARGYAGQYVLIVPDLDLVMVLTHDTFESHPDAVDGIELLTNFLFGAAGAEIDPTNECASFDLHRIKLNGKGRAQLTQHVSADLWGAPSPDGEKIAFHSRRDLNWEIYIMDADGTHEARLTHDGGVDSFPVWSPDGHRIAFARDDGDESGIYVMDRIGGHVERLTEGHDFTPAWSPAGDQIAFNRTPRDSDEGALWVVGADGSEERRLEEGFLGTEPSWSPDGRRIAFWAPNGHEAIYTVDAEGGDRRLVAEGRDPRYLPNGSLVFASKTGRDGTYEIVRNTRGRQVTVIDTSFDDLMPFPSADGKWITFASASPHIQGGTAAKMNP